MRKWYEGMRVFPKENAYTLLSSTFLARRDLFEAKSNKIEHREEKVRISLCSIRLFLLLLLLILEVFDLSWNLRRVLKRQKAKTLTPNAGWD